MREHYIARHMREPEVVEREIAAIPLVGPAQIPPRAQIAAQSQTPAEIAARAQVYQKKMVEAGQSISITEAVNSVMEGKA